MPLGDCICEHLCETWCPAAWTPAPESVAAVATPEDVVPGIEGNFGRGFVRSGLRQVLLQRSSRQQCLISRFLSNCGQKAQFLSHHPMTPSTSIINLQAVGDARM